MASNSYAQCSLHTLCAAHGVFRFYPITLASGMPVCDLNTRLNDIQIHQQSHEMQRSLQYIRIHFARISSEPLFYC